MAGLNKETLATTTTVNNQKQLNNTSTNFIKDTSFLRWLNPFNLNTTHNNNTIYRSNLATRGSTPNLRTTTTSSSNSTTPTARNNSHDLENTDLEYRGVEGLKQFWNNHINISKSLKYTTTNNKSATLGNTNRTLNHQYTNLTASQSIGCLLTTTSNHKLINSSDKSTINAAPININPSNNNTRRRRSSDNFYKYKTAEIQGPAALLSTSIDTVVDVASSTTAQQIAAPKISKKTERNDSLILNNDRINHQRNNKLNTNTNGINFPLTVSTAKGEKICWAKREDILIKRQPKSNQQLSSSSSTINESSTKFNLIKETTTTPAELINKQQKFNDKKLHKNIPNNNLYLSKKYTKDLKPIHSNQRNIIKKNSIDKNNQEIISPPASTNNKNEMNIKKCDKNYNKTINIMAIKSSDKISEIHQKDKKINQTNVNEMAEPIIQKIYKKPENSNNAIAILAGRNNNNSSNNLLITDSSPNRKKTLTNLNLPAAASNSVASVRKYSFRTNGKNSYSPRKTVLHHHYHHHHHHPMGNGGSKVAALTLQFNQMLEKDAAILKEVQKNNGILMARAGHVYKIKEDTESLNRKKLAKRNANMESEEGSIKLGKKKSLARKIKGDGTVRATIRKFESTPMLNDKKAINNISENDEQKICEKPKIPEKSENVLKRTQDLHIRNIQKKSINSNKSVELSTNLLEEEITEENKLVLPSLIISDEENSILEAKSILETDEKLLENQEIISQIQIQTENEPQETETGTGTETETETETGIETESKKSRYIKIYEKFRFHTQFFNNENHKKLLENQTTATATAECEKKSTNLELEPDHKIQDALKTVNMKLEHLSKSTNDVRIIPEIDRAQNNDHHPQTPTKNIKPNQSFLFRPNSTKKYTEMAAPPITQEIIPKEFEPDMGDAATQSSLVEAINIRVISKTQSMDETKFPSLSALTASATNDHQNEDADQNIYRKSEINNDNLELYDSLSNKSTAQPSSKVVESVPQKSFLYTRLNSQTFNTAVNNSENYEEDNIYQTVNEALLGNGSHSLLNDENIRKLILNEFHDDCNNYESLPDIQQNHHPAICGNNNNLNETEDGYIICDAFATQPPVPPPLPLPLPLSTVQQQRIVNELLQRNTRDELPAIPQPKRNIQQNNNNNKLIATRKAPPAPHPTNQSPLPEIPNLNLTVSPAIPITWSSSHRKISSSTIPKLYTNHGPENSDEDEDENENIYDTIRANGPESITNGYEFLTNKNPLKSLDNLSISSNCYETINSGRRISIINQNSDTISETSSDNRTNSLYGGMSINNSNRNSILPTTNDNSSDNNSDDWVDISDADDETSPITKQQFVVVRERTKCHRSPDWSKRVRDQRLQKQSEQNYLDDDSDHYYEPLFPSGVNEETTNSNKLLLSSTPINNIKDQQLFDKVVTPSSPPLLIMAASNQNGHLNNENSTINRHHHHHHHHHSDEYDSFDTDDETDEDVKKNDSGVDISNIKLPDPPAQPTNQVYAFVKKVKNFISNKKGPTSPKIPSNNTNSNTTTTTDKQQYENTQFYVPSSTITTTTAAPNEYQNTKFPDKKLPKKKTPKLSKKAIMKRESSISDSYENTEFHAPIIIIPKPQSSGVVAEETTTNSSPAILNNSKQLLNDSAIDVKPPELINRRKSKSEKSFKSKLRKSLTGSSQSSSNNTEISNSLHSPRSTFYISDSVDLDSGIFEKTINSPPPSSQQQQLLSIEATLPEENVVKLEDYPIPMTRKSKRNLRSPDLNRRRTTIGIRPNNPPPPPPSNDKKTSLTAAAAASNNYQQNKPRTTTSWYAECGVFKTNGINDDNKESRNVAGERNSNASWYADAGLYQTSGASVASSSGSSGVSTGGEGEGGPGDDNNSHSMFQNEPLYQIYSAAKLESISRDMEDQDSADGYEEIGNLTTKRISRPSALQLVGPKQGPSRTLWSEIPEVIHSEILSTLTPTERRLQEAKFEILTSEASYLKSLNLLRSHFMNHPAFRDASILKPSDRKILFSHIVPVHECSDRLLSDLESCWQDNIMLLGLSKSIYKNAEKYFQVYIAFCEHQGKMDRTLRQLKEQQKSGAGGVFNQILETLEMDPICCGLNLHSFLMLPMQRITRLPLLIDAVFSKVKVDDDEYDNWKMTLSILNKIVAQCNEAANRYEQAFEIQKISRQIEFPTNIRSLAIAPVGVTATGSKPRTLVKKGDLVHLIWRGDDAKLTFGKKFTKCHLYAFLFTDLLILSKKKSEEQYIVFDYCPRNMLTISSGDSIPQLPTKDINQAGKNLILMTLLENHEGKTIEMIFSCPSVSDQQRWLEATTIPESETPGEKLYETWDCPQVITKHEFLATEPDLLSLEPGDVVNVTRKLPDGWYQGERIRDGVNGWFPGNYTEEVNSAHVRARNLKQRYRLLTFTATYLEMQKRK